MERYPLQIAAGRGLLQPQYLDQLSQRRSYLHRGILDQGQLRPLGFAVDASRQRIMRRDGDLQRLAQVVPGRGHYDSAEIAYVSN